MNARDLTSLAGIAVVIGSVYLFTRPVVSGRLQCGSVFEPESTGQGLVAVFTEAACVSARNSAQNSATVVAVVGVLLILVAVYWPARDRSAMLEVAVPAPPGSATEHIVQQPGAGWYDDPQDPTRIRYWDGTSWAVRTAAKPLQP